jgi:hypothetical protein
LPVLVGPSTAVTPRARSEGGRERGWIKTLELSCSLRGEMPGQPYRVERP